MIKRCRYEPPHTHEFPNDWTFGGANGEDPRADSRWEPTTYRYLDERLDEIWYTQTPLCDDQAIDEFTRWGRDGAVYLQVRRPGMRDFELLPWQYDAETDTVFALGG